MEDLGASEEERICISSSLKREKCLNRKLKVVVTILVLLMGLVVALFFVFRYDGTGLKTEKGMRQVREVFSIRDEFVDCSDCPDWILGFVHIFFQESPIYKDLVANFKVNIDGSLNLAFGEGTMLIDLFYVLHPKFQPNPSSFEPLSRTDVVWDSRLDWYRVSWRTSPLNSTMKEKAEKGIMKDMAKLSFIFGVESFQEYWADASQERDDEEGKYSGNGGIRARMHDDVTAVEVEEKIRVLRKMLR